MPRFFYGLTPPPTEPPAEQQEKPLTIPVDKSIYRIRFDNETENHVDIVIEPK